MTEKKIDGRDYVVCQICGKKLKWINNLHLRTHNITLDDYKLKYPNAQLLTQNVRDGLTGENNPNYGIPISDERRKYLSEINSGEKHPKFGKKDSDKTRKKKSDALIGKPKSDEHKTNISIAKTGTIRSEESKINQSISMTQFYEDHPEVVETKSQPGESNPNFGNKWSLQQRIELSCKNRNIPIEEFDEFTHIMASEFFTTEDREKWRTAIFQRDDYTCQECGIRGGNLNSHHLLPFRDYPDPQYSLNPANGITLCVKCHRKTFGHEYEFFNKYFDKANGIKIH